MQFRYVTSMSREQFDLYGEKMLRTFVDYWPEGEMLVYSEDRLPDIHDRILHQSLWSIPGLREFHEALSRFPICRGEYPRQGGNVGYDYRRNIVAFSKKAFAQCAAAHAYRGYLFWIDADVTTRMPIPGYLLEKWMEGQFAIVMRRKHWHLCSSFVGWDCANEEWWQAYRDVYESGRVLTAPQWDDAFVLGLCLEGIKNVRDIAEQIDQPGPHNVFNDVFGDMASHAKGNLKYKVAA